MFHDIVVFTSENVFIIGGGGMYVVYILYIILSVYINVAVGF